MALDDGGRDGVSLDDDPKDIPQQVNVCDVPRDENDLRKEDEVGEGVHHALSAVFHTGPSSVSEVDYCIQVHS